MQYAVGLDLKKRRVSPAKKSHTVANILAEIALYASAFLMGVFWVIV